MKSKKIKILEKILRIMALLVLKRYRPKVIGITGSVGKTSSKEAVFAVLTKKFTVRKNEKNYNNEIGIPLTIIGVETGGSSLIAWAKIFFKWIGIVIYKSNYPEILILELGVDRPGDMQYLLSFIKPTIGVVTNISSSHIEFFKTLDNIAKEKGKLIEALPEDGFAILNADDLRISKFAERTKARIISFGFTQDAQINAEYESYYYEEEIPKGISFKLRHDGTSMPIRLNQMLAEHQINAALSAVAVGIALKINLVEIAVSLENFTPPAGRLNVIKGVNESQLIDDTYNASPTSTNAALDVLGKLRAKRKIVVLGDMLELGNETEIGHRSVGKKVFEIMPALFFAIGERMKFAIAELKNLGYEDKNIFQFTSPIEAAKKIKEIIEKGDLILIKGSQGMRMEKAVFDLMENKQEAKSLLCRQSSDWVKKPFMKPFNENKCVNNFCDV